MTQDKQCPIQVKRRQANTAASQLTDKQKTQKSPATKEIRKEEKKKRQALSSEHGWTGNLFPSPPLNRLKNNCERGKQCATLSTHVHRENTAVWVSRHKSTYVYKRQKRERHCLDASTEQNKRIGKVLLPFRCPPEEQLLA